MKMPDKNNAGAWLAICIALASVAGYVMHCAAIIAG
jgi:hypothetical protein